MFSDQLNFYELAPAAAFKRQLIPLAAELQHPSKPNAERAQVWKKAIPSTARARSGVRQSRAVTREPLQRPAAGHGGTRREQR